MVRTNELENKMMTRVINWYNGKDDKYVPTGIYYGEDEMECELDLANIFADHLADEDYNYENRYLLDALYTLTFLEVDDEIFNKVLDEAYDTFEEVTLEETPGWYRKAVNHEIELKW